jgi:hypothetical protein
MYSKNRFLFRMASTYGPIKSEVDALESDRRGEGGLIENGRCISKFGFCAVSLLIKCCALKFVKYQVPMLGLRSRLVTEWSQGLSGAQICIDDKMVATLIVLRVERCLMHVTYNFTNEFSQNNCSRKTYLCKHSAKSTPNCR